jgi:hypothetical protein
MKLLPAIFAICAAFLLGSNGSARAGDYIVTYAIDADGVIETGKLDSCVYRSSCMIEFGRMGLLVFLVVERSGSYHVNLSDNGRSCCYFADATSSIALDTKVPIQRLRIFEGRRRRKLEVVQNDEIGVLDLIVSDLR